MDAVGLGWTIAGVIVAGAIGLVSLALWAVTYFRANPKRRIEWKHTSRPVIGGDIPASDVEFKVQGIEVKNPHFNEFTMRSRSRADIGHASFDGGKPISVHVYGGAIAVSVFSGYLQLTDFTVHNPNASTFDYGPQLIRKGASTSFSFVSNGPAKVTVSRPLLNIDVEPMGSGISDKTLRIVTRWVPLVAGAALTLGVTVLVTEALNFRPGG